MDDYLNILDDYEFSRIKIIIYNNFGITLDYEKKSLIISRLKEYLKDLEINKYSDYVSILERDKSGKYIGELVDRISTNHTYFFREMEHYNFFLDEALVKFDNDLANEKDFRMWCAGCSFGDEPYSFQILLFEYFKSKYQNWKAGILATDISEKVLGVAKRGRFSRERLRFVPNEFKEKYFIRDGNEWEILDKVKNEVLFRRFNLMNYNFPYKRKFHIISCRNVMIYFSEEKRKELLKRFYDHTEEGGYLFIGHSEYIKTKTSKYKFVVPGIYMKES
jgi:chemotaxis protein methyltransferase CheR